MIRQKLPRHLTGIESQSQLNYAKTDECVENRTAGPIKKP